MKASSAKNTAFLLIFYMFYGFFFQALLDFCDSYHLVCTKPTVWVLHYLNTSGASSESKIIGVYATRADGTDAINKALGMKIHSKSMHKR